jgi:hypothetical protein
METFPIEGDPVPEGYNGWLLFLDEFNSATQGVQAAAYKLVLDRMVGVKHLHKNVAVMCAGNLDTDGAIVQEQSTALQSRLVHMELIVDAAEWCDWGAESGKIFHRITDFIKFKPSNVYTFTADHTDKTYSCPRTLEFANRFVTSMDLKDPDLLPLLAGTLSEGVARELLVYMKIYDDLPKMADIQQSPTTVQVPDEPSILYALTGSLAHNIKEDTADQLMKYVSRLPAEFQVVTLRETVRRKKEMLSHKAVQKWINESAVALF